ncbi:MAG: hypothetical protein Q8898_17465, partial [Bacillota bacterium]|nr:hypothetical protein [Bacillota bacterium]
KKMNKRILVLVFEAILCMALTTGCGISVPQTSVSPAPSQVSGVNLTKELNTFRNEKMVLRWTIQSTPAEKGKEMALNIDSSEMIDLVLAEPIYVYTLPAPSDVSNVGLEMNVSAKNSHSTFFLRPLSDHSILIGCNGKFYYSASKDLYEKAFELAQMKEFHKEDLATVSSIDVVQKLSNGKLKTKTIKDADIIQMTTKLLSSANNIDTTDIAEMDVELILHTKNTDIDCVIRSKQFMDWNYEIIINRLQFFASKDFVTYMRSLL